MPRDRRGEAVLAEKASHRQPEPTGVRIHTPLESNDSYTTSALDSASDSTAYGDSLPKPRPDRAH